MQTHLLYNRNTSGESICLYKRKFAINKLNIKISLAIKTKTQKQNLTWKNHKETDARTYKHTQQKKVLSIYWKDASWWNVFAFKVIKLIEISDI